MLGESDWANREGHRRIWLVRCQTDRAGRLIGFPPRQTGTFLGDLDSSSEDTPIISILNLTDKRVKAFSLINDYLDKEVLYQREIIREYKGMGFEWDIELAPRRYAQFYYKTPDGKFFGDAVLLIGESYFKVKGIEHGLSYRLVEGPNGFHLYKEPAGVALYKGYKETPGVFAEAEETFGKDWGTVTVHNTSDVRFFVNSYLRLHDHKEPIAIGPGQKKEFKVKRKGAACSENRFAFCSQPNDKLFVMYYVPEENAPCFDGDHIYVQSTVHGIEVMRERNRRTVSLGCLKRRFWPVDAPYCCLEFIVRNKTKKTLRMRHLKEVFSNKWVYYDLKPDEKKHFSISFCFGKAGLDKGTPSLKGIVDLIDEEVKPFDFRSDGEYDIIDDGGTRKLRIASEPPEYYGCSSLKTSAITTILKYNAADKHKDNQIDCSVLPEPIQKTIETQKKSFRSVFYR